MFRALLYSPADTPPKLAIQAATSSPSIASSSPSSNGAAGHKQPLREEASEESFWLASKRRTGTVLGCVGVPLAAVRLPLGLRILSGLTVIAFLVHMALSEASFGLISCTDVKPDVDLAQDDADVGLLGYSTTAHNECPLGKESRRLVLDLDVCCYNPDALRIMYGVGVPAILVFAVGIPLVAGLRLWWVGRRLHDPDVIATMGFLMAGFRDHAYYWEVVIMIRKLSVVAITVLVEPMGVRVQTYSALMVIFVAVVCHLLSKPYTVAELNTLELVALIGAFFTFIAGLFLHDPNSS